ncbi:CGG triplet repeat-binding protein 1 [Rhizophagus irregularis DAOM 181602=DAOM 197198]|nr:CGG triplet repeat-binding protein 1 [Rhizophagus irregularis DAOM 181602=DAOM 197198]
MLKRKRNYKNVSVYIRCNEYEDIFRVDDKVLFCNYCNVSVEWRQKSTVDNHCNSQKHISNMESHEEQNKAQQLTLVSTQVAADLKKQVIEDLIEAFAIADIPLEKVNSLFPFFKKHVKNGGSIPQALTLRQIYLPNVFERDTWRTLPRFAILKNLLDKTKEVFVNSPARRFFDPKYIYTGDISQKDIWQYNAIHEFANPPDELLREWGIYCGLGNNEVLGKIELNQYWLNKVT